MCEVEKKISMTLMEMGMLLFSEKELGSSDMESTTRSGLHGNKSNFNALRNREILILAVVIVAL
jgi:hypothetical protein